MILNWQLPEDNSDTITRYSIQIRTSDGQTYAESDECDGEDAVVVDTRQCSISLQTLRAAPFNLVFDEYVYVRVNSYNSFGWSMDSQPATGQAKILTEPIKMSLVQYDPLLSPFDTIYLSIVPLTTYAEIGGSELDEYMVEQNEDSTDVWELIQQGALDTFDDNYSLTTTGNVLGYVMNYRARARNIHGWGDYSDLLTIVSSTMPERPQEPTVSIEDLDV